MARLLKMKTAARVVKSVKAIGAAMPFCYRYRLADPLLKASIQKHGILMPLLVSDAVRPVVIAGHKRLHAAKALKMKEVPVVVAGGVVKPKDAFLLNLVSNWRQACPEMDRVNALRAASRDLGFKESDLLWEVMPLLGLPGDKATLELFLKLDQFPGALKDLIEDGQLPLRGIAFLLKFSRRDQSYFAQRIASRVKLTSSQLLQAGECLSDMMKRSGQGLEAFCRKNKVLEGLDTLGMDPRTKADKFFARIKRLRSPRYADYRQQFEERVALILRDAKEIRLEPVQGFEEPGFELHIRVKTPEGLELLLKKIAEKRSALNSLFEIML